MTSELYPLKFNTIFKEKLWGGRKIKTILSKDFGDLDNCGETWELSGIEGNVSTVKHGALTGTSIRGLIHEYKGQLVGNKIYQQYNSEFPLLIKFIDAAQDLSIQVHPDDRLAKKRHNSYGKTEMWYILHADIGSTLISGFKRATHRREYLEYYHNGQLMDLLRTEKAVKGDAFYLPAGRIHTIGKGLLLAEIQRASDITYRLYDFDRVDKNGKKRKLNVEQALNSIDFNHYPESKISYTNHLNRDNCIVSTPFFIMNKWIINATMELDRASLDCFKIYIGIGGSGVVAGETIAFGEILLVPAFMKKYFIEPKDKLTLLEIYIDVSSIVKLI